MSLLAFEKIGSIEDGVGAGLGLGLSAINKRIMFGDGV